MTESLFVMRGLIPRIPLRVAKALCFWRHRGDKPGDDE
jgi:hypothetical protein